MLKRTILGCALGAFFFIGCNQSESEVEPKQEENALTDPELYEQSELALLMRQMYEDNLELKKEIIKGNLPESFPEDFYNIHDAVATPTMIKDTNTFRALADQYIRDMEKLKSAGSVQDARIAYNQMVKTCASCHTIYCQGPLDMIHRMEIKSPVNEKSSTN